MFAKQKARPKEPGIEIATEILDLMKKETRSISREESEKIFYSGGQNFKNTLEDIRLTMRKFLGSKKVDKKTEEDVVYLSEQMALMVKVK